MSEIIYRDAAKYMIANKVNRVQPNDKVRETNLYKKIEELIPEKFNSVSELNNFGRFVEDLLLAYK